MGKADEALLQAKAGGKNVIVLTRQGTETVQG